MQKLKAQDPAPVYALSVLEAARHNKTKVLEAHLSLLAGDERVNACNSSDPEGRTPAHFTAFYGNLDGLELLCASEASI